MQQTKLQSQNSAFRRYQSTQKQQQIPIQQQKDQQQNNFECKLFPDLTNQKDQQQVQNKIKCTKLKDIKKHPDYPLIRISIKYIEYILRINNAFHNTHRRTPDGKLSIYQVYFELAKDFKWPQITGKFSHDLSDFISSSRYKKILSSDLPTNFLDILKQITQKISTILNKNDLISPKSLTDLINYSELWVQNKKMKRQVEKTEQMKQKLDEQYMQNILFGSSVFNFFKKNSKL